MKLIFLWLLLLVALTKAIGQNNYVDSLKQKLALTKEDTGRVNLLASLARIYTFTYPDTAVTYANQGLQLAKKIGYTQGEANCLSGLCLSSTFLGDYTNALDFGMKALPLFESLRDTAMQCWTNIQLMNCYRELEDYGQALIHGYNAKKLFGLFHTKVPHVDSNQVSVGLAVIGSIFISKNQLDSALYYEQKAFIWDSTWSGVFLWLGEIYAGMGNVELALNYYRRGLAADNNSSNIVPIYIGMSKAFESTGGHDSSMYYANKAVMYPGVQANPEGLLAACTQLAKLYERRGIQDSTIKYLKAANTLKDSLFSRKKTREAQSFAFNEQLRQQELTAQQQQTAGKLKLYALLVIAFIILLVAFLLFRNNRHRQKAYTLLQNQKQETDKQKTKAEQTLAELKSTQSQLIQSEKMASLGELTAGIAHEIQNPLNFVNNFSEVNEELLIEMKAEMNKGNIDDANAIANDIIENEEKINHHGKRADAIVKGMLQHSRSSTGVKEPTDINALADEYLRLSYHGLRAKDKLFNADFKTDFDNSIGKINIVPQDIGRVLLNLYNNAFYAVNEKAKQQPNGYEPAISVSSKKINNKVELTLKDNGNGIPQKVVDKIFQPFFTTKPTGEGTGLGLSLSYDIIKAHGGEIKVETKGGEGSEFIIQLPLNEKEILK